MRSDIPPLPCRWSNYSHTLLKATAVSMPWAVSPRTHRTSALADSWQPAPVCSTERHLQTTDTAQKVWSPSPLNLWSKFPALKTQTQFLLLFMSRLCVHILKHNLPLNKFAAVRAQCLFRINLQKTHHVSISNFPVRTPCSMNYCLFTEYLQRCSMSGK